MLSRLLLVAAAIALLAGCTSPSVPQAPAADVVQAAAPPLEDQETIEAFRVVPRITVLDWTESIHPEPCRPDVANKCQAPFVSVNSPLTSARLAAGLTWNRPQRTVVDDDAVFWRVS